MFLVVDKQNGPYRTILEAVESAPKNTEIRIASGLYTDNVEIKTPGLRLVPKDKDADIIWVAYVGPAVTVNIEDDGKVFISNFKFAHTAISAMSKEKEKKTQQTELFVNVMSADNQDRSAADDKDPNSSIAKTLPLYDKMNTLIYVKKGKIEISVGSRDQDSILSLNFIQRQDDLPIPAVVLNEGTSGKFVGVEIKGKKNNPTLGIISRNAQLVIEECNINNLMSGGVLIYNTMECQCRITRSKFIGNLPFNIEVIGCAAGKLMEDKTILIEENTIVGSEKDGIGVKIGVGSRPKLFLNTIKELRIGLYIISSDPFVYRNSIVDCKQGIVSTVFNNFICEPRIKINEVKGHLENGILISGKNNMTVVISNTAIKDNRKAGIRVENHACARIVNNKISNNLNQGILVVEQSNAFIEGNYIYQNIKANIAFGGQNAENTVIHNNKIFNSASEGIFVILAARCSITMNEIHGNYDGIIAIESVPEISFNNIFRNRNNGLILLRGSKPDMRNNNIYENEGVGLVLREKSYGPAVKNTVKDNEMDLIVEYKTVEMEKDKFFELNKIGEERRLPQESKCTLI